VSSNPEFAANELACANVANACLIHKVYPEPLLQQLMSYERISTLLECGEWEHLHLCAQIHFVVEAECPTLRHCTLQPPHNKVVPALVLAESMVNCPRVYSVFHQNICKALLQITGSARNFTREALTTFSSFIDAEVILDREGTPLPIPQQWGGWSQPRKLLTAVYPEEENASLWHAINQFCDKHAHGLLEKDIVENVSVASDWDANLGNASKPVTRKVAFEADGPRHFAVNCRHRLGNTVLKHRLLEARGWNVLAISHFDWEHLVTEQEHVDYLVKRLYHTLHNMN
jgi:hypothetical protein